MWTGFGRDGSLVSSHKLQPRITSTPMCHRIHNDFLVRTQHSGRGKAPLQKGASPSATPFPLLLPGCFYQGPRAEVPSDCAHSRNTDHWHPLKPLHVSPGFGEGKALPNPISSKLPPTPTHTCCCAKESTTTSLRRLSTPGGGRHRSPREPAPPPLLFHSSLPDASIEGQVHKCHQTLREAKVSPVSPTRNQCNLVDL